MQPEEVERVVSNICAQVMGLERIEPDADLLSLGGTSLSMILIVTEIQEQLHIALAPDLAAQVLFSEPTIRGFAKYVSALS